MTYAQLSYGAASPEEAAKLGTTLTAFGAEKAGNKDGSIPAYTGGVTKPPANYVPKSGRRPDPFAGEKPLFSINAQNVNQYADKITDGTKELMRRWSSFRIDIYKTHRSIAYPEWVLNNTVKNATRSKTYNGGLSLKDAHACIPFPIPHDGYEVMWNHLTRYQGRAWTSLDQTFIVDSSGRKIPTGGGHFWQEFPYYDESNAEPDTYWKLRWLYTLPARKAGEAGQWHDPINPYEKQRVAYLYLPGQRRVKLAPEIAFDAKTTDTSGNDTWDEVWLFNGSMERYNVKLIGKKEMYVPYNNYKAEYWTSAEELFKPNHLNPDLMRWELHRVWVVDMTVRPGKRHIYAKRRLYIDEDSWTAVAGEIYDRQGIFYKVDYLYVMQNYDFLAPCSMPWSHYNLSNGVYAWQFWLADDPITHTKGYLRENQTAPQRLWSPETLASGGR
jgi:hypothetical protein